MRCLITRPFWRKDVASFGGRCPAPTAHALHAGTRPSAAQAGQSGGPAQISVHPDLTKGQTPCPGGATARENWSWSKNYRGGGRASSERGGGVGPETQPSRSGSAQGPH